MARLFAYNLIFFLLPFAGYAAWLAATRGSAANAGNWPMRTIGYLAIGGAVLMLAGLVIFGSFSGAPPGGKYVPASLDNGVLIPGHFD